MCALQIVGGDLAMVDQLRTYALVLLILVSAAALWPRRGAMPMYVTHQRSELESADVTSVLRRFVRHPDPRLHRIAVAAGTILAAVMGLTVSIPVAITAAVGFFAAGRIAGSALQRRSTSADGRQDTAALTALAAELRAGQPMDRALRAVSAQSSEVTAAAFRAAARSVALGGDPIPALAGSRSPIGVAVGTVWRLSDTAGCPLADAVASIERDARLRLQHRDRIRSLLAGPRATAVLLAILPVLGLAMGGAIGADPVAVLTRTPIGGVLLIVGTALLAAGVAWMRAIVANTERRS